MKYYAVLDTNVLVSALLKWDSVPGNVLQLAVSGTIVPILSRDIVEEYRHVLSRPKFHFTDKIVEAVIGEMEKAGIYIEAEKQNMDLPDPKDVVFYEVVMEERNQEDAYLVTGNIKHFPQKPYIVTPRQMIDIILEEQMEK